MLFFWHTVVLNWFCLLYTLSRPQSFELKFPMPIICLHLVYVHYFQLQWQMAPLSWGLRLNKTTFYPHQNLLQLLKLKIKHMVTAVAHAMFSSPLSFACRCATKKYCGLRNEMQPVRHGMALWVLLRCAQLLLNSISCCEILFYCFISKPAQADCPFNLLMGILYLTWSTSCCFNMDHCYFCESLLLVIFPGEAWQGRNFMPL